MPFLWAFTVFFPSCLCKWETHLDGGVGVTPVKTLNPLPPIWLETFFFLLLNLGHFIPPEKVHEELFREWHIPFKKPSFPAVKRYNQNRTLLQKLQMEERFKKKEKLLRKRLAKKGINYEFPSLVNILSQNVFCIFPSGGRGAWFLISHIMFMVLYIKCLAQGLGFATLHCRFFLEVC